MLEGQEGAEVGLETVLEGLADELVAAETSSEEEGSETAVSTPEDQLNALIAEAVEVSKPKFEVGEDGLSLQGSEIQGIQSQIQQLESRQGDLVDSIKSEITESRQTEIDGLKAEKFKLEGEKTQMEKTHTVMITEAYMVLKNQVPKTTDTLKDFTKKAMSTEAFSSQVSANKEALDDVEAKIEAFDAETQTLIETVIQDKKTELQKQLTEAQAGYIGSGAEAKDKKVLLERQIQEQLTDPNALFSDQNIDQIFTTYGSKEGLARFEALKQESDQAREQAARDEIRQDIMSRANWYDQIPELAEALSTDIKTKLEVLQQSNPESDTIKIALSLDGSDRLAYLIDSEDSQLRGLAFWFDIDSNIDQVIAEHPQFAQYLDKETNKRYEQKQQEIREGSIDGAIYLGSSMDNTRRLDIDNRISSNLERSKGTEIEALQRELYSLKLDENGNSFDREDQSMIDQKEKLRPAEIEKFKSELSQALKSGQVQFENGKLSLLENIPAKNEKINQEQDKLLATISPVLEIAGYEIKSLDGLADISSKINEAKEKAEKKLFGLGNNTAKSLEKLDQEILKVMEQYNQLQSEKQSNISKFEADRDAKGKLDETYNNLPKAIKDKLTALENSNLDLLTQAIDTGVSEIQNYQTPPEIVEKRQKIQTIESQIAETKSITAPTAKTQPSA